MLRRILYITVREDSVVRDNNEISACLESRSKNPILASNWLTMRKVSLLTAFVVSGLISAAQTDTALISLEKRLNEYIVLNKELNFEKLFDYIHPNIFKIAPRKQMVEAFKNAYNSKEMAIGIDTIRTKRIGENFQFNGAIYRLVDYYMVMWLQFKDESMTEDSSLVETLTNSLQEQFASKEVFYQKDKKVFIIKGDNNLIAIKDTPNSLWMFLSYEKGNPYASRLFPPEVISHFKLGDK